LENVNVPAFENSELIKMEPKEREKFVLLHYQRIWRQKYEQINENLEDLGMANQS